MPKTAPKPQLTAITALYPWCWPQDQRKPLPGVGPAPLLIALSGSVGVAWRSRRRTGLSFIGCHGSPKARFIYLPIHATARMLQPLYLMTN
jgi:hypothetical protein